MEASASDARLGHSLNSELWCPPLKSRTLILTSEEKSEKETT